MSRKKRRKTVKEEPRPAVRSGLHEVLRTRKAAPHRPDAEKRAQQKLRRDLEDAE